MLAGADLSRLGLPGARAEAISHLARAVSEGSLALDPSSGGLDETIDRLCQLPGLGDWTAQYIAMRALGEPDAFPASDLGIRRALGGSGPPLPARRVGELAEAWRPWRAYAAMHLWVSGAAH